MARKVPLVDAIYRGLTGRTNKLESGPLKGQVDYLEKRYGSISAASRATGVSRSTLRRWRDGQATPKPATRTKLTQSLRQGLVPQGRRDRVAKSTHKVPLAPGERSAGPGAGGMTITAMVRVSNDVRERTLRIGQHANSQVGEALTNAFLTGDDQRVSDLMSSTLGDYFGGSGWDLTDVTDVSFTPIK